MQKKTCPNYSGCQIINVNGFVENNEKKNFYITEYCESIEDRWQVCKRYLTKKELNICPDFIFPDTVITIDEILDKIENN